MFFFIFVQYSRFNFSTILKFCINGIISRLNEINSRINEILVALISVLIFFVLISILLNIGNET